MATLHCTRDTPPESTFTEIQILNKFSHEQFQQLTGTILTFLTEPSKTTWLTDELTRFSEQHGINLANLKNLVKTLLQILKNCLKLNLDASLVREDMIVLGLEEQNASYLSNQWRESQAALSKGALSQTLIVNQLVDMEWKFGVTAASSELTKVGSTFLQLKLVINKGHTLENVYMELTLPQFYSFLHEMEKAKSSLEFLC